HAYPNEPIGLVEATEPDEDVGERPRDERGRYGVLRRLQDLPPLLQAGLCAEWVARQQLDLTCGGGHHGVTAAHPEVVEDPAARGNQRTGPGESATLCFEPRLLAEKRRLHPS